jgi:peptidoglycan/LPS O-acetylase OafA/YrhL
MIALVRGGSGMERQNDFDLLRLAAAVSVMFSHAF